MTATMRPVVDILIEEPRWQAVGLEVLAETAARAALADQGIGADGVEISLLACDDARIAVLNADFRGRPQPTNVLSWPSADRAAAVDGGRPRLPRPGSADMPAELGDIAIAWQTCAAEAEAQGKPLADHASHLVVHATLHLLGYDHIRDADAALMEAAEVRILATLGLANPYE